MEYVSPEGLRVDGRRPRELRRINCQLDVLDSADGSAIFEMGNTKVLAAVFGPHEVSKRSELREDAAVVKCEYAMAAFSTGERRRRGKGDRRSAELSAAIRNTLEQAIMTELLPRSQIDIYVQVLQADGGTRCAAINAAVLAAAVAGIPLRGLMSACAAGHLDGTPLLDLNYIEDAGGGPDLAVALLPGPPGGSAAAAALLGQAGGVEGMDGAEADDGGRLVLVQMDSRLPLNTFQTVLSLARDGCRAISAVMRGHLLEHTKRLATARGLAGVGA